MSKDTTYTKKIVLDGGAIRLYTAKTDANFEFVQLTIECGNTESKITQTSYDVLRDLRDACNEALKEMENAND